MELHIGIYYHCNDVWDPQIGNIRVHFFYARVPDEPATIIAKQQNGEIAPYKTSKGMEIALMREVNLSITQMFFAKLFDGILETWKLRGVGLFVL